MRTIAPAMLGLACVAASCTPPADPVAAVVVSPVSLTLRYSEVQLIDFEFDILAPLSEDTQPRVFVHLYDEPGNVLRTFDHPFPGEWLPGGRVHHTLPVHQSALGPPLRAGRYALSIGLYEVGGRRWPLDVSGTEVDEMEYAVVEIAVSEPSAAPMFRFSEGWKPIEAGVDRQVLGRRWLTDQGSIWVTEAAKVRSVWMSLQVPAPEIGVSRLLFDTEVQEPAVVITSPCIETDVEVSGVGLHAVELPIYGENAGESGECEMGLRPNFHLVQNGSGERRTVQLESLAWSAEADS